MSGTPQIKRRLSKQRPLQQPTSRGYLIPPALQQYPPPPFAIQTAGRWCPLRVTRLDHRYRPALYQRQIWQLAGPSCCLPAPLSKKFNPSRKKPIVHFIRFPWLRDGKHKTPWKNRMVKTQGGGESSRTGQQKPRLYLGKFFITETWCETLCETISERGTVKPNLSGDPLGFSRQ